MNVIWAGLASARPGRQAAVTEAPMQPAAPSLRKSRRDVDICPCRESDVYGATLAGCAPTSAGTAAVSSRFPGIVPDGSRLDTLDTPAYDRRHPAASHSPQTWRSSMTTRREFLTVGLVATGAALSPRRADAGGKAPKALTTVRESSFIKAFDDFFVKTLAPEYDKLTGIKVGYEAVSVGGMLTRLTTMAETKSGPEITGVGLNWPFLFDNA